MSKTCVLCGKPIDRAPHYVLQNIYPLGEKNYVHVPCYEGAQKL